MLNPAKKGGVGGEPRGQHLRSANIYERERERERDRERERERERNVSVVGAAPQGYHVTVYECARKGVYVRERERRRARERRSETERQRRRERERERERERARERERERERKSERERERDRERESLLYDANPVPPEKNSQFLALLHPLTHNCAPSMAALHNNSVCDVCYSVLQCIVVCCSVLQCVAVCCNVK